MRFVQGDGVWLSPFYRRDSISIAVHRFFEEDYQPFFAAIEPIFIKYGGRPHWGKHHSRTREDFAAMYPHWGDFNAVRRALEPGGKFLNAYLGELFGIAG